MSNSLDLRIFDEKEIIPNGRLEDMITAAVKLTDSRSAKGQRTCCYVFFGITDLLDVKQSGGYREVILREAGDVLLISKLDWAASTLKGNGILPVFCTFPPMSFEKHNQFLLKNGLTNDLQYVDRYQLMQSKLNDMVVNVNKHVEEINCNSGVATCQLAVKIFAKEKTRFVLRESYLRDGLHLTSQGATLLNLELAQNLRKVKQGKRSPNWLMKAHKIKSTSALSFSIKKKDLTINPEALEAMQNTAAYQSSGPDQIQKPHNNPQRSSRPPASKSHSAGNKRRMEDDRRYRDKTHRSEHDTWRSQHSSRKFSRSDHGGDYQEKSHQPNHPNERFQQHRGQEDHFQSQSSLLPTPALLGDRPSSLLGHGPRLPFQQQQGLQGFNNTPNVQRRSLEDTGRNLLLMLQQQAQNRFANHSSSWNRMSSQNAGRNLPNKFGQGNGSRW